jgi:copper chaperone NosL
MLDVRTTTRLLAIVIALALPACAVEPQPILLGAEECSHCRMVISDAQFTSQALTTTGKAFTFDAVECMASWVLAGGGGSGAELHSLWAADFADPERWIPVEEAVFLRSEQVRSPMGLGLSAHATAEAADRYRSELGGELLGWSEVLALVERHDGHGHRHHARN